MRIVEAVYRSTFFTLKFHRDVPWVCSHSCALEEHVASRLKTHSFSSGKVSWSLLFFFSSTVLSVFSLKCFLSTCWASWTVSLVSFFSYFPSHLLAVLSGRCTQPCLISFCWGFHSCSLISKISLVLWIFRITSCSYFMVVILSNGIFSPCNISFLQVVYFGFSLIIKAFLRYLAGEPWSSAHL